MNQFDEKKSELEAIFYGIFLKYTAMVAAFHSNQLNELGSTIK